jgi:uncharacterized repeat protein (TIGR02543 family)
VTNPTSNLGWFLFSGLENLTNQNLMASLSSREDDANAPELTVYTGNPELARAYADGEYIDSEILFVDTISSPGGPRIQWESPYPNGHIFGTIDGSQPTLLSPRYTQPFYVNVGTVMRFVSYSSNYSSGGLERRITLVPLPVLTINVSFSGAGDVTDGRVTHRGEPILVRSGAVPVSSNKFVRYTAMPRGGWTFDHWSGDLQSTEPTLEFTVTSNLTLRAHFVPAGPEVSARRIQGDFLLLQFSTVPELDYTVQDSADLDDWSIVQTLTQKTGPVDAIMPIDRNKPRNFYRVVSTPRGVLPPQ